MTEVWKPVVGHEGEYEVSDFGRVRSLDRIRTYTRRDRYSGNLITSQRLHRGQLLRPGPSSTGHLTVVLGRGCTRLVHRLVLEAFNGPCPPGMEGLHSDDNPSNNAVGNLRWGTRSDNLRDAVRNGKKPVGQQTWNAKLRDADIPIIRSMFGSVPYCELARLYGVNESTIRQIKDGKAWTHIKDAA